MDYPRQALQAFAAEEAAKLPPNAVFKFLRQEQPKERLRDSFRELDLPIRVEFPDGMREALLFVIENESTDRKDFLHYLAIVCLELSKSQKTRRVVPVALHPFRKKPLERRLALVSDAQTYLDFNCVSCTLGTMQAREHLESGNIVERLCLPLMGHEPKDRFLVIASAMEGLAALEKDREKQIKYMGFVGTYGAIEEHEKAEFERYVLESPFGEDVMTLAKIWEKTGKAEGRVEGEAIGRIKSVLELHEAGTLTAEDARATLESLFQRGKATRAQVDRALKAI